LVHGFYVQGRSGGNRYSIKGGNIKMNKDKIKDKIINYYHSHDEYYDKLELVFSERANNAIKIGSFDIMKYAKDAQTILDVGCGTGALLRYIKAKYPEKRCFGLDVSPIAVNKAKRISVETGAEVTFAIADMEKKSPFPDNYFDLVIAHEVLEHFVHPDRVINNIALLLKRNGIIVIIAPNTLIRSSMRIQCMKMIDFAAMLFDKKYLNPTIIDPPLDKTGGDSDAVYISNPWELQRMISNAGLTVIKKSYLRCRLVAKKIS
jgi:ubiquinone/menaquinone biosynthesis C-methylase UbiE